MGPVPLRRTHAAALIALVLAACSGTPSAEPTTPPLPPRLPVPALPAPGAELPIKRVTIAWTAEVRGEIEVCGCPTVPYGGFERRERYLDRLREQGDPVIVLDAGEMLKKGARLARAADEVLRASTVLKLAAQVGLDAWAPSPTDLQLKGLTKGWDTAVAANVEGMNAGTVIERGGARIGVIGVSGGAAGHPLDSDAVAQQVAESIRRLTPPQGLDGLVVISNADTPVNTAIAQLPSVGMVLTTRGGDLDPPLRTEGAPIIEAPDRGRFVSVVRWVIGTTAGPAGLVEDGPDDRSWQAWDDALERLPLQTGAARDAEGARIASSWQTLSPEASGRNLILVRDRPLGTDLDIPTSHDETPPTLKAFQKASVDVAAGHTNEPATRHYMGTGACISCHNAPWFAAWAYTPHAGAWKALVNRQATQNPECVGCHSTAWGEPGGNASTDPTAMFTWKAVQCESCHGPLSEHVANPSQNHTRPVTQATCLACHDPANSPQFNYTTYLQRVSCVSQKAAMASTPAPPTTP